MKYKKKINNFISWTAALVILLLTVTPVISAMAEEEIVSQETLASMYEDYYSIEPVDSQILSYSSYWDKYSGACRPMNEIYVKGSDITAVSGDISVGSIGSEGDVRDNVMIWSSSEGEVSFEADVEENGLYSLNIVYFPIESNSSSIELSMKIDEETPFDSASRINLNRVWVNERDIYTDSRENQIRPPQIQYGMWQSCWLGDSDGLFSQPLIFYFEKGRHEISFTSEKACLAIESVTLGNPAEPPEYSEYSAGADVFLTPSALFRIEGESASYKSDATLYPTYDNTDCGVSPSDPIKVVYNTIGGGNWKKSLQSVTWTIPKEKIPADGWYKLGIKARQNEMRGFFSNRRIYIDDEVVCKELEQVKFRYDNDWQLVSPSTSEGENVYIYLTADSDHTIKMEAIPGEIGDSMRKLDETVSELNTYYRQILMITGPNPDKYTDYYVHEKIPGLVDDLDNTSARLKEIQSDIEELSGSSGSEAAAIERMTVILDKCVEKPLKIPDYLPQIKDNIASISAWMRDYRDQPLEVDYIEFASWDRNFSQVESGVMDSLEFGIRAFFGSFFEDYTTLSDVTDEEAIEVWVSLGRDQALVVKEMTENEFIPKTNIPVAVNLVSGGVTEAALAGKGPDIALFLGEEYPVNLAARGLLVDLREFSDYDMTAENFGQSAMVPYTYNNSVYGLPISRSWPMMFYRTDILTELGFTSPPETWDDLIDMLPELQRNYMSVGLVLPDNNISPATETGHTFAMMLLQKGINYYNEAQTATLFDTVQAVDSFEMWTDFYTKYSFNQSYDDFSRFRTGEYPIVISDYTFFNQLITASPEIKGLWDFVQVPGTLREDGTVSHAANSNGSGAVIFKQVKNKENAWEYIKWFTGTEAQVRFASQIEGLLGTLGRFETANIEALKQLSWSPSELDRLMDQQEELEEIPIIPASYGVTRNIMNAFREVVNEAENPRDTLMWYNRDINEEIARKRKNMGLS